MKTNGATNNGMDQKNESGTDKNGQLTFVFYKARDKWRESVENSKSTGWKHTSLSGEEIDTMYGPTDLNDWDYTEKLGFPGQYPYTRGIHANMYRGKVWTMRQFAGHQRAVQVLAGSRPDGAVDGVRLADANGARC